MTDEHPNSPIAQADKISRSRRARARRSGGLPTRRGPTPPNDLETEADFEEWVQEHLSEQQSFETFKQIGDALESDDPDFERQSIVLMNAFVANDEPVDVDSLCRKLGIDLENLEGEM